MLFLLGRLYPRMGFDGWKGAALLGLLAANPFTITFSGTLLSELLFVAFLAGCLLLTEKAVGSPNGEKCAAAAGVVMGLGYLTRSAGIVSLVALPLFFLIRRRWKHAAYFAAAMLPFVAGWMTWVKLHQASSGGDPALMYYIDYTGYQIYNVSFSDLHLLLWKNIDGLVWAFGSLAFSRISDSLFLKILAEVIGVAMISGVIRMVRRGNGLAYGLFALGSCLLLIIWHFPPNERFV